MSNRTNLIAEPATASVFDTVLQAHRADSFNAGYHRAVNDLLADFALVAKDFLRERATNSNELREALRDFQSRYEQHLEQASSTSRPVDQYVDGGLGI